MSLRLLFALNKNTCKSFGIVRNVQLAFKRSTTNVAQAKTVAKSAEGD